jgi:hypothetical protein
LSFTYDTLCHYGEQAVWSFKPCYTQKIKIDSEYQFTRGENDVIGLKDYLGSKTVTVQHTNSPYKQNLNRMLKFRFNPLMLKTYLLGLANIAHKLA